MIQFRNLPVGWCFTPDDEKLIKLHLIPKVIGSPLLWDGIVEKNLYGVDAPPPWEMFNDIDGDAPPFYIHTETNRERTATRKTVYVFTKQIKAAAAASKPTKPRVSRRAGGGTWSGQSGPKYIHDSVTGDIIGYTRQLTFRHKGVDEGGVGRWIMHEYSLNDGWGSDFVLCKISRCTTHPVPAPAPAIVEEEEEEEEIQQVIMEEETSSANSALTVEELEKMYMNSSAHYPDDFANKWEKILDYITDNNNGVGVGAEMQAEEASFSDFADELEQTLEVVGGVENVQC